MLSPFFKFVIQTKVQIPSLHKTIKCINQSSVVSFMHSNHAWVSPPAFFRFFIEEN